MKKVLLKNIYQFDEESQEFVIDIALDSYQDLFNDWDASPTWKKDLNPELTKYLEASSYEIPRKNNIRIDLFLPLSMKKEKNEEKALRGISNHFMSALYFIKIELNFNFRKILSFILLGFIFITTSYVVQSFTTISFGFDVLMQGIYIGGWVLLWEAFSLFFFSMHALRKRKAMYLRFLHATILFKYKTK